MVIICPKVTKSWSTVCSVLSSKDAKNNRACLLEAKDMKKRQPLCPFTVCKQLSTKKNSLDGLQRKGRFKVHCYLLIPANKTFKLLPGHSSSLGAMFWALPSQFFPWPCCCSQMLAVCLGSTGHGLQIVEHDVPCLPGPLQGSQHSASMGWDIGKDVGLCKHKLKAQPVKG